MGGNEKKQGGRLCCGQFVEEVTESVLRKVSVQVAAQLPNLCQRPEIGHDLVRRSEIFSVYLHSREVSLVRLKSKCRVEVKSELHGRGSSVDFV